MAVSAAALPDLNAKLFEGDVDMNQRKFACFYETFQALVEEQVQEQEVAAVRDGFKRCYERIEADVESSKLRFYSHKFAPAEVESAVSWHAYREKVGACAHRKYASLHEIVAVYKSYVQQLANDLLPLLHSEQAVQDAFARSRDVVRARFNC